MSDTPKEPILARAVQRLCERDVTREARRDTNISTCFATGLLITVGALISFRFSIPLVAASWIWCGVFALYFWIGRLPSALFGVDAMFEDEHRSLIDGALTRTAKTMWLKEN
jgi:hypothetical protein